MKESNFPIYLAIAVVFGILIGTIFDGNGSNLSINGSSNEKKLKRLLNYIDQDYVDNVNTDKLLDETITNMLEKLDPHSVYIPKEKLQAVTESMQGNFVGIGVQFREIGDTITVIQPIKGGPSIKAGIKSGDRILLANKDTLFGRKIKSATILKKLKGKPNTDVELQIYRKTNDSIFNVTVTRGEINIKSVDIAYMLNDSIGYIKLDRFAQNTYREFKSALTNLKDKGMTDLVLDLRGNGGGFIHIANKIIDEFLEDDKLIVYTKDKDGNVNESFATSRGEFEQGGLYVLIDENSASASEIVAGALQDNDKGTIIGRRSFGKGLVQEEMDLGDGSAIRLTTARYYTPTGRSIQKPYKNKKREGDSRGVKYGYELDERYHNGELFNRDSIRVTDSLQFKTPKGKLVYGGGGITPDVFVSMDSIKVFYPALRGFAFDYVDNNRKRLSRLSSSNFIENFDASEVAKNFSRKYTKGKLSKNNVQLLTSSLKAFIGGELFGDEVLYKIFNLNDKMIDKVFELESNKNH